MLFVADRTHYKKIIAKRPEMSPIECISLFRWRENRRLFREKVSQKAFKD